MNLLAPFQNLGELERSLLATAQEQENRDPYGVGHCQRVAALGLQMGERLLLSEQDLSTMVLGGYLHDIGKISVPDSILFKRDRLNGEEWTVMQMHCAAGVQICSRAKAFEQVLPIIRHHHERWDGSGYPDGLKGTAIPLLARVFQTADLYDALRTSRPYKRGFSHDEAVAVIREDVRRGWRDPALVGVIAGISEEETERVARSLPEFPGELSEDGGSTAARPPIEFYSCFVSHSSVDAVIAKRINDDLRRNGIKSWYAPEDFKIGDRLRLRIDESIKLHDKLLLILSAASVRSAWVETEVETALEHERRRTQENRPGMPPATILFPITIDDAVFAMEAGWAAEIRRTRHIGDFRDWPDPVRYEAALQRLLRDLAAV